ncbi:MAG TPA: peptidylprolyl isomerase [Lacunisphaera sp.]
MGGWKSLCRRLPRGVRPNHVTPAGAGSRFASTAKAAVLVLALSGVGLVHGSTADIDTTDALVIGTHHVSAYRVEKSYRRFAASKGASPAGGLRAEVTRAWLDRFLIDQVLTAQALKEGYGERSEVTGEVRRMERNMLTQFSGPFYEHLRSAAASQPAPIAPASLRQSGFDVEILRAPIDAPIARQIRDGFGSGASPDQEPDLLAIDASGQAEHFSGSIAWPFEPFEEIAEVIGSAPVGQWQKFSTEDAVLIFRVRSVQPMAIPPADQAEPSAELAQFLDQRRIQKERQRRIVRESGLTLDWPAVQRWVDRLVSSHPDPLLPLDQATAAEMLKTTLASFRNGKTSQTVTVADYISHYNDLYMRRLPRNPLDVLDAIRTMIVAQRDVDEAREIGIDRELKFSEDRRNYRDLLALDLYVKERVRPALGVSDDDVRRFYEANKPAFARPTRVEGTLLTFSTVGEALALAKVAPDSAEGRDISNRAKDRKVLVLTPTSEVPALSFLPNLVFSGQPGPLAGPFQIDGAFAVWVFGRVLDSETRPLAEVSQEIRAKLEEPRLERQKAELARKLSPDFPVEDKVAYKKYGVDEPVTKPWSL